MPLIAVGGMGRSASRKREALPGVLAEIAEVAGTDAALAIAESRGGTDAYIPADASDDHWLVQLVGRQAADLICRHFAFEAPDVARHGVMVTLPMGRLNYVRMDQMIVEGRSSAAAIARACGVTSRTVFRRRAALRKIGEIQ